MTNKEKADEISEHYATSRYFPNEEESAAYDAAIQMAKWKDEQFHEERDVLLNLLKLLIAAGGDTKIIEQLIDTLDDQTIIKDLKEMLSL